MAKFMEWSEEQQQTYTGDSRFLKLKAGPHGSPMKYKLRLIGKAIGYMQHWDPVVCRSPGRDEQGNILDPLMLMVPPKDPKPRYSIWVIDRADGQFKVVDFSTSLYKVFSEWRKEFNEEPGGKDGPDWRISVELPKDGDKRGTEYSTFPGERKPLTDEERAEIAKLGGGDGLKKELMKHRADHTPEQIIAMLMKKGVKLPAGLKAPTQQAEAAPSTPAAGNKAPAAPASDDMEF